ncbi:MAG: WD40 repeat domain-containing protein [Aggregatilineales bacterium]
MNSQLPGPAHYPQITPQNAWRTHQIGLIRCAFIAALRWSADGCLLAVAHGNGVWIWRDALDAEPHLTLPSPDCPVKGIAFHPRTRLIATASADAIVRLWNMNSGQCRSTIAGLEHGAEALAFHPEGHLLAIGGIDGILRLLDLKSGSRALLEGHQDEITALAFTPDGMLISASRDGTVRLWRPTPQSPRWFVVRMIWRHEDWVRDLSLNEAATLMATACKDGTTHLFALPDQQRIHVIEAHEGGCDAAALSADGAVLASGGRDARVRLWDTTSGTLLAELDGHTRPVLTAGFNPAGTLLITGSGDNSLRIWAAGDDRSSTASPAD